MLCRSHFIMFCLSQNSQFPEFLIQFFHISRNSCLNHAKVVIIHLLSLWRLRTKKSASCKSKIFSLFIHFLCNEEILLLRSYRSTYTFHRIISKQMKDAKRLLIQSFHRTKQRSFFIQCLSAIGTERCRNT